MKTNLKLENSLKISNFKFQIPGGSQAGFTIVEVLVVALILGVIGYMMSDILSRSLQGSQKTAVIGTAKQNGQVAIDTISQVVRNSDVVVCIGDPFVTSNIVVPNPIGSTSGDIIVLYSQNGQYVRFRYEQPAGTPIKRYIAEDQPVVNFLISNNPADPNSLPQRVCDLASVPVDTLSNKILTDTDPNNGVLIQTSVGVSNIFTVTSRPGSKSNVTVQFDVKPSNTSPGFENQLGGTGVTQFQQTIQLR